MPLSRETIRESYIQNLQAKNQQRIDARRSGIDYSEDYLFQELIGFYLKIFLKIL
jgi:hypothetical protein